MAVEIQTRSTFPFSRMIESDPVMKADIPAAIPASIVSANAGLTAISDKMFSPAGIDSYSVLVKDVPITNNIGIAIMRTTDHFPNDVLGAILQAWSLMLFPFLLFVSLP